MAFAFSLSSEGLVSYWKMDDSAGVSTIDSKRVQSGDLNGVSWGEGKISGGLLFDGLNSFVNAGNIDLIGTGDRTVCVWIKPISDTNYGTILSTGLTGFVLYTTIPITTPGFEEPGLKINLTNDGNNRQNGSDNNSIFLNEWQFVCVWRNSLGVTNFFVNGKQSNVTDQNAGVPTGDFVHTYIGAGPLGSYSFNGYLDELSIWERILSGQDIIDLYNDGNGLEVNLSLPNSSPVADAGGPYFGEIGVPLDFNALGSYDSDSTVDFNDIVSYEWDCNNGEIKFGALVSCVYNIEGSYNVTLTITDTNGASDRSTVIAVISPPAVDIFPPEVVVILSLTDTNNPLLFLDWGDSNDSSGLLGYNVYKSEDINFFDSNAPVFIKETPLPISDSNYSLNLGNSSDGNYCFFIQTLDNAGNDSNSETACFVLDVSAPLISIISPQDWNYLSGEVSVALSAGDSNFSGFASGPKNALVYLDNNYFSSLVFAGGDSNVFSFDTMQLNLGLHNLLAVLFDNAGNSAVFDTNFFVDNNSPWIVDLNAIVTNNSIDLSFLALDENESGIKGFYLSRDQNAWVFMLDSNLVNLVFDNLSNGDYNFYLIAVDNADNNSAEKIVFANVNYSPPVVTPSNSGSSSSGGGGSNSSYSSLSIKKTNADSNADANASNNDNNFVLPKNKGAEVLPPANNSASVPRTVLPSDTVSPSEQVSKPTSLYTFSSGEFPFPVVIFGLIALAGVSFLLLRKKEKKLGIYN